MGDFAKCPRPMTDYDQKIADTLIGYIANFARTGNPNGEELPVWTPTSSVQDEVMCIDDTGIHMAEVQPQEEPAQL